MANIEIPIQNAGIGDAIAIQNDTTGNDISHFKAFVGESVTQNGLPSGYTWYGIVYGREKRGLMVRNNNEIAGTTGVNTISSWINTTTSGVSMNNMNVTTQSHPHMSNTTIGSGTIKIRNGNSCTYAAMNVERCIETINSGTNTPAGSTNVGLHPKDAYYNGSTPHPMCKTDFDNNRFEAKDMYGTYKNYIAQTLPLLNTGPFKFRCGKANTKELAETKNLTLNGTAVPEPNFPAADYCYTLHIADEAEHHWWLPDMYELYMMMRDESFQKCYATHGRMGGTRFSEANYRWSSVRYSATNAWNYYSLGFANANHFYYGFTVCPVTLLPL